MSPQQTGKKKSHAAMEFREEFFYSSASSSKRKRDIGMGPMGEMMLTYRATNALLTNSGCSQNCGLPSFCNTSLFLLATHVLPASPNFGQAKHGQNDPAATVCQQCICCPICEHHFTHWTHPDISLRFRAGGRRYIYKESELKPSQPMTARLFEGTPLSISGHHRKSIQKADVRNLHTPSSGA